MVVVAESLVVAWTERRKRTRRFENCVNVSRQIAATLCVPFWLCTCVVFHLWRKVVFFSGFVERFVLSVTVS